jgi:hypothetical protein
MPSREKASAGTPLELQTRPRCRALRSLEARGRCLGGRARVLIGLVVDLYDSCLEQQLTPRFAYISVGTLAVVLDLRAGMRLASP